MANQKVKVDIPTTFNLGGVVWTTRKDEDVVGRCSHRESVIEYRSKINRSSDKKLSESSIKNTFNHELIHAILGTMAEWELHDNEKFVQSFANLLTEYELSKK